MINRFIEWYLYQTSLPMTEIKPKDEILLTIINAIFLIGIPALAGIVTAWIEKKFKDHDGK